MNQIIRPTSLHYTVICLTASLLTVVSCATPTPPSRAVVEFTRKDCPSHIDARNPITLTPEKKKAIYSIRTAFTISTPCVQEEGKKAQKYILYKLPIFARNHVITAGGEQEPIRALATTVSMLDENMAVTRRFGQDNYLMRGNVHAVQFKPRENERYILVATDSSLVGNSRKELKQYIQERHHQRTKFVHYRNSPYTTHHGAERKYDRTFSYEGIAFVKIHALSGKIAAPAIPSDEK